MSDQIRPEHPRPDWVRPKKDWKILNGEWRFAFDDLDEGLQEGWYANSSATGSKDPFDRTIIVPFAHQTKLSKIHDRKPHEIVWYKRSIEKPSDLAADERLLLHFGAVDYHATVWVEGNQVKQHTGGHVPFYCDITHILRRLSTTELNIVVRAEDAPHDVTQPRGKQYWQASIEGIWYHPTTGIWQTVWMERVPRSRISRATITPDIDRGTVRVAADLINVGTTTSTDTAGARLHVEASIEGTFVSEASALISHDTSLGIVELSVAVHGVERPSSLIKRVEKHSWTQGLALWSPDHPTLYTLHLSLVTSDGRTLDEVTTYTGMRKIHIADGKIYLNNQRIFQALSLDQGYWPDAGLTAPSDHAFEQDIQLMKDAGLNGCRKHQKVEDPRFLYWADKLGYLVWSEMANAYDFSQDGVLRFQSEWSEAVRLNINHPCVIAWTPINESWGVPSLMNSHQQRDYLRSLYYLTKTLDPTRPVISNDGWEQGNPTDIIGFHDYGPPEIVANTVKNQDLIFMPKAGRQIILSGDQYKGQPIILTEMGGFSLAPKDGKKEEGQWGYEEAEDEANLLQRIKTLVDGIIDSNGLVQGFCYTQTTDTEQEVNGILTQDRKFKIPVERLREVFGRRPHY